MRAFLLHFKKSEPINCYPQNVIEIEVVEDYSVWATEELAYRKAGQLIAEIANQSDNYWSMIPSLRAVVRLLLESNKYKEMVELLNDQAHLMTPKDKESMIASYEIKIVETQFLGSPFE